MVDELPESLLVLKSDSLDYGGELSQEQGQSFQPLWARIIESILNDPYIQDDSDITTNDAYFIRDVLNNIESLGGDAKDETLKIGYMPLLAMETFSDVKTIRPLGGMYELKINYYTDIRDGKLLSLNFEFIFNNDLLTSNHSILIVFTDEGDSFCRTVLKGVAVDETVVTRALNKEKTRVVTHDIFTKDNRFSKRLRCTAFGFANLNSEKQVVWIVREYSSILE